MALPVRSSPRIYIGHHTPSGFVLGGVSVFIASFLDSWQPPLIAAVHTFSANC